MAHLLPNLSAERVAQELVKLLETSDPVPALRMMQEDGVLSVILPEARRLDRVVKVGAELKDLGVGTVSAHRRIKRPGA